MFLSYLRRQKTLIQLLQSEREKNHNLRLEVKQLKYENAIYLLSLVKIDKSGIGHLVSAGVGYTLGRLTR